MLTLWLTLVPAPVPTVGLGAPTALSAQDAAAPTPARVLAEAPNDAWRALDPEYTVRMRLETGSEVILELVPGFAPRHVENIRALIRAGAFDGGAVVRSQDNYVVQWAARPGAGDGTGGQERGDGGIDGADGGVAGSLEGEFFFAPDILPFTPLPDGDVYAPEVGFMQGFPVGRDPARDRAWLLHCYGVVGVARGEGTDSGNGSSLYAVNGHSPRHLDGNLSMPGRVVSGMEHLSSLRRGTDALGFYETDGEMAAITSVRLVSDLPAAERPTVQVMRTDSPTFADWIEARRTRVGAWWVHSAGKVSICNVTVPTRDPSRPG